MQLDHCSGPAPSPRGAPRAAPAVPALALALLLALPSLFAGPASAQAVDEDAASALAKKGGCLKCHSVDKRKKAPSYKEIAAKHRGKPDAFARLYKHMHGQSMVKTEDGDEEHAPPPEANQAEKENLIRWILSR